MKRVLIVGGSDSGGGAGIQADLKTAASFGVWGATAVTAVTVQNTTEVAQVHGLSAGLVAEQIRAVLEDIGCDAVKVGMLKSEEVVCAVSDVLHGAGPVVLDPVIAAGEGRRLLSAEGVSAMKEKLFPVCELVIPNAREAEILTGSAVRNREEMKAAARKIRKMGPRAVLVKGGRLEGAEVADVLVCDEFVQVLADPRVTAEKTHGTGCILGSAIAALMARGKGLVDAVRGARSLVRTAIQARYQLGGGAKVLDPLVRLRRNAGKTAALESLKRAFCALSKLDFAPLVPEVQTNFVYALSDAALPEDVAAFPGRIVRAGNSIASVGDPVFGASRHMASCVLTAMQYDTDCRACINIRYSRELVDRLRECGFEVLSFDRGGEPAEIKSKEGSTLQWGMAQVLREAKGVPDVVFDRGGFGKEAMVRVFGRGPGEIVEKIRRLLESYRQKNTGDANGQSGLCRSNK